MMMMMFCIAECLIVHVYVLLTMIVGKVVVFFVCGYQKCSHDMFIFLSTIAFSTAYYVHIIEGINGIQQHKHGEGKVINKRVDRDKPPR